MERWISLDGAWTLYFTDERRQAPRTPEELLALGAPCIPAQVPGNVELDLSRAGMLPEDLFQGMNPRKAEAFEPFGWWYVREFPAPESAADERVFLRLDGVDCLAEYFFNGERIGASENAFMPHEFDVTDRLRPQNALWVHIRSALLEQLSQPYAQYLLTGWHIDGGVALRKPAHSFGWDIFPRAVTAGLWKSVRLAVRDAYAFAELGYRVRFDRVQTPSLEFYFSVDAPLEKLAGQSLSVRVAGRCGADSSFFGQCALDRAKVGRIACAVENPKLWWPYGYGEANVYDAVAELLDGETVVARRELNVGLRQIRLKQSEEPEQLQFQFEVNGVDVFCRGSNWVPLSAYHSLDRGRYARALALVTDIGCNMLRIWGGGVYEQACFYDYCDRHGILVWQDFMMACQMCPMDDAFRKNLEAEVVWAVRTLRHHPCIALWAGDNEIDECLSSSGRDPSMNRITREWIPQLLAQHDAYRPYLPSSPYISSAGYAALQEGRNHIPERHLWGARDYYKADYYANSTACFVSETGYHGCPAPESVRQIVDEDCVWPWSNEQWTLHSSDQRGDDARVRLMADQITQLFAFDPQSLEDFSLASQISQAEAKKFFIERVRAGRPARSGVLWWNLLDGWPQMSDAVVDYFFRKKLAYAYIRRAQAPFALLLGEMRDWNHTLLAANDTLETVRGACTVSDIETGAVLWEGDFLAPPNRTTPLADLRMFYSEQRMLLIRWTANGKRGFNHYLCGMPPFSFAKYKLWLAKLQAVEAEG